MTDLDFDFEKAWGDAGDKEFKLLPDGYYDCEITEAKVVETPNKSPTIKWEFTVFKGELKGSKTWEQNVINEKGMYYIRRNLEILGLAAGVTSLETLKEAIFEANGKAVTVKVGHKTYNGNNYNTARMECLAPGFESGVGSDTDLPI